MLDGIMAIIQISCLILLIAAEKLHNHAGNTKGKLRMNDGFNQSAIGTASRDTAQARKHDLAYLFLPNRDSLPSSQLVP